MRPLRCLAVALVAAVAAAGCAQPHVARDAVALRDGMDAGAIDVAVRPQDDFFRHVNGTWLKTTPIPADQAYRGSFNFIHDKVQDELRALVEQPGDGSDARRIGDLYRSFLDEAAAERAGLSPLASELAAIDAVANTSQLAAAMGRLTRLGVRTPLDFGIEQDARDAERYVPSMGQSGLGLPDREYYLDDDVRFREARSVYTAYVVRLLELSGRGQDAAAAGGRIVALETALARGHWTRVANRDPVKTYNRYALAALAPLAPGFDWAAYFGSLELSGKATDLLVGQPDYLGAFAAQLQQTPLAVWRDYLRVRLLHSYAPYLGKAYVDARFAYVGTALSGTSEELPRWKRGIALVEASEGEALGRLYVDKHFPPASKARMEKIVANLLAAYRDSIDRLDWMGTETKREAQAKLATFAPKIGYPKRWRDYGKLVIRADDLVGNVQRARAFEYERQLAKLGAPVDRDEWLLTPQAVNAYYYPLLNEIVFPAAVLQPPFFDAGADDAVNYGAIGAIIGHEISHGFDDSGSRFDGTGNLREWWTAADRERFAAKTKALVAQYAAYSPLPGYTINGELTLGENIADNSGLEIAYKAYRRSLAGKAAPVIGGRSGDERFFFGFAQAFRGKARDAALLTQIKSDPHSPDEFRVNGVVRNHPAFYESFKVKPGDAMYLPPERRVSIW